jgi:Caspase domain
MSPRFVVHDVAVAGPATHALVIGVGSYPHLLGGSGPQCADNEGLGQLKSPTASATLFANWLIEEFANASKPLASLAMLISDENNVPHGTARFINPRTAVQYDLECAKIDNVQVAVNDWKDRANSNPENMTIFYFCGHGIAQAADAALLVEDYGAINDNALDGAIDFRRFHLGMMRCAAAYQCYFIDACRASSDVLIENLGNAGRILVQSAKNARRNLPNRQAPVFYASLGGASAYARPGKPSVFTDALVRSFGGAGADDADGPWRVTSTRLLEALDYFMRRNTTIDMGPVQIPATGDSSKIPIHEVCTPRVPVEVMCNPGHATPKAKLGYVPLNGQAGLSRPPGTDNWMVDLSPGGYDFTAEFPANEYKGTRKNDYVRPPYRRISLEVQP